jgi:CheY-like chemotaxis protein
VPVRAADEEFVSTHATRRRVAALQSIQPAPRILIVDDEPNNRGWLMGLLRIVGFTAREAEDGAAAIRVWQEWKPDLILMDVRMPVMDGIEAIRRIRLQPGGAETVIIALTASALDDDRRAVVESGADDFLSKPCEEDALLQKMGACLNVSYLYEDMEDQGNDAAVLPESDCKSMSIGELPAKLIGDLTLAVQNGEKDRLDQLIEQVGKSNAGVSYAMKTLADNYDYDALTLLLEGAAA